MQQKTDEKSDEIMEFPDALNTVEGLKYLDSHLISRSYVTDYQPTHNDDIIFRALGHEPSEDYCNALRWYRHMQSFGNQRKDFPKSSVTVTMPVVSSGNEVEIELHSGIESFFSFLK